MEFLKKVLHDIRMICSRVPKISKMPKIPKVKMERKFLAESVKISTQMTIQKRILSGFIAVIVLVFIMSAFTYYKVGELNVASQEITEQNLYKIELVEELANNVANEAVAMRRFNSTGNLADVAAFDDQRKYGDDKISKLEIVLTSDASRSTLELLKKEKKTFDEIAAKSIGAKRENNIELVGSYMDKASISSENSIAATRTLIAAVKLHIKDEEEISNKNAEDVKNLLVIVSLLVAGISVFISIYISHGIARKTKVIGQAATEIASGNLTLADISVTSADEIGQLAHSFNRMKASLRTIIQKVEQSAEQVSESSHQLTASANQSARAANQVAGATANVADGSERQLAAVCETSAAVQQMLDSVQRIADSANQVAEKSVQATDTAATGSKTVEKAIGQMLQIENTVNTSAKVVVKLGEQSTKIGQIVETMSEIAAQTNLLALNAAIEAARAGEHGRGFAVVASEVKKLAEQSQEAAKKIAALIGEIQGDTDKAVKAMKLGTEEVKLGAEVVTTTGKSFQDLESLVLEVSSQIKEISTAIHEMADGSEQIIASVKAIDHLSKQASEETQTMSAATQEQSASIEEIAASSQELAKMSQDLRAVVGAFQV
ncbi:MAG: methyl-accepting chemotaxis sensory transducer [Massilibacillus sp.]|jgi:methyl-accepting chemotaxis protein|nr:methyl-accepting chemotaxis sensory transducer [Massilibacillus sp.]